MGKHFWTWAIVFVCCFLALELVLGSLLYTFFSEVIPQGGAGFWFFVIFPCLVATVPCYIGAMALTGIFNVLFSSQPIEF